VIEARIAAAAADGDVADQENQSISSLHVRRLTDGGSAAPNSADRQHPGTPLATRTALRTDRNKLLGVSCNRLLGGTRAYRHSAEFQMSRCRSHLSPIRFQTTT
jgi:hypothetical protein